MAIDAHAEISTDRINEQITAKYIALKPEYAKRPKPLDKYLLKSPREHNARQSLKQKSAAIDSFFGS